MMPTQGRYSDAANVLAFRRGSAQWLTVTALFMWLQKYYVEGVTGGAVKG